MYLLDVFIVDVLSIEVHDVGDSVVILVDNKSVTDDCIVDDVEISSKIIHHK